MNSNTQDISQLIRQYVKAVDPETEVILYGSRARGDARSDSDWDILLLTGNPVDIELERKYRDKLYDLELDTGESLSLFIYSKDDWQTRQRITPFYQNVTKEGMRI
ncbi:MAG: nucleotidyltransferase domain-containing protein [Candidatus Cloacimonetes bacterium]|jgi:predicted nucleotidyltransferase|nr:nucleotidyltransferase domain-containing protein [Candidatus Cloacimonadota bacterium]